VMDWKPPKSVHQIHSFVGLAGYCHHFIPDFSRIAKPMTKLLKKGAKFVWSEACEKSFHTLRLSYGPPWAHCLGGYQDRLLGGPLGLPDLRCTAPASVEHKDYRGEVLR
jgi:hypothetical protein